MGGDGINVDSYREFSSLGGHTSFRKDSLESGNGGWEWTPVEESLEVTGLWPIKEYIQSQQATIAAYISNCLIHELCKGGIKDDAIYQINEVVGSSSGTGGRITWRILQFKNNCVGALLRHIQEGRGSDSYPMMYQAKWYGMRVKQLKSQPIPNP